MSGHYRFTLHVQCPPGQQVRGLTCISPWNPSQFADGTFKSWKLTRLIWCFISNCIEKKVVGLVMSSMKCYRSPWLLYLSCIIIYAMPIAKPHYALINWLICWLKLQPAMNNPSYILIFILSSAGQKQVKGLWLTGGRWLPQLQRRGRCRRWLGGELRNSSGDGGFGGVGRHTLAARAHHEGGGGEWLRAMRGQDGGRPNLHSPQLLNLLLQPPVLLRQRLEPPLEVLTLQLRLPQLAPALTNPKIII